MLKRRIDALEGAARDAFFGPTVWVALEPGETSEEGLARHEAMHGLRSPGQPTICWRSGVPRGEGSICTA
jgi:hypothetical protein